VLELTDEDLQRRTGIDEETIAGVKDVLKAEFEQ
jgi:hypothetical protein